MSNQRGEYIITEGTDATGKTSVANALAEMAYNAGHEVIRVDEPDGAYQYVPGVEHPETLVPISSEIRKVIKDGSLGRVALTNIHLFTASRVENWNAVIAPALDRGAWVLGARNRFSTEVYQGYAEGYDLATIEKITELSLGPRYMHPDHLYILDLDDETERARRIAERGPLDTPDTFESRDAEFQSRLINGYRTLAQKQGISLTDASRPKNVIATDIWNDIQRRISAREAA